MTVPHLEHIEEFRQILHSYAPSAEGRELLRQAQIVAFVGATAAGRQTLINALIRNHPDMYHNLVSDTTRPPKVRNGVMEQDGHDYFFRSEMEILEDLRRGAFLEAAIIHNQQVSGISLREIQRAIAAHKIALSEIQPNGAASIHAITPDARIIFVIPPNFSTWLARIRGRGDLNQEELQRRLTSALAEFNEALTKPYYQLFVNDEVGRSAEQLHAILTGAMTATDQVVAQATVRQLLVDTQTYINAHFL